MEQPSQSIIILYGTNWCYASKRVRNMMEENHIPYQWVDIDKDSEARSFVEQTNHGFRSVPTLLFPDGSTLTEPSDGELRRKLGLA